jgi:hypothetical protein
MDGRLWNTLYREVTRASKPSVDSRRAGRPRVYGTVEILLVWAYAALIDRPISVARKKLLAQEVGWPMELPLRVPSLSTLTRRAKTGQFRKLLRRALRRVRHRLGQRPGDLAAMDSTFLLTGPHSRDGQSRWSCHGGKWFRGYALHTICDDHGVLWAWQVTSANVQEMKVARRLVRQLALAGKIRWLIADSGYDSEPLHQLVRRRLGGRLLAPLNRRGAKTERWRDHQPGRDFAERMLRTRRGGQLLDERARVERWYSSFKATSYTSMLPHHARTLGRVRRWVDLKILVFFVHQWLSRQELTTAA